MFIFKRISSPHSNLVLRWRWTTSLIVRGVRSQWESPRDEDLEKYLRDNFQVPEVPAKRLSKECSISDVEERIKYFQSIGLSQKSIGALFKKFARPIMSCDATEMEKKVNFLSGYTTRFRQPNILTSHLIPQFPPLIFRYSLETMKNRVKVLEKCNFTDEEIAYALRYNPMIVLAKLEVTFDDLSQYLKDFGVPDQSIHKIFTKHPRAITYRREAIERRVQFFMDELGYTRERIITAFNDNAMVFTANVEKMREKSKFIKGEMGLTNASIMKSPLVLRYSLERLQWRYHYLCQIGYTVTDDTNLLNMLYISDEMFAKRIAHKPVKETLQFKEEFYASICVI